jgi:hypothetical protein
MPASYPYVSSPGALVKAIDQFRKAFPSTLDAEALQKFNIAPANESYVVNTFRFLGLIDEAGKKIDAATEFFYGDDESFAKGLEQVLIGAYGPLFTDFGAEPWNETRERLTTWFRVTDKTSDLVGGRQAQSFLTLAALAGHGEVKRSIAASGAAKASSAPKATPAKSAPANKTPKADPPEKKQEPSKMQTPAISAKSDDLGLTVRVEVNLPATGTPATYDAIFASIRKHLIDR